MWTSLVLHRTVPLGVTVALHHPCLGARMAVSPSCSCWQGSRQAHRFLGSGKGNTGLGGVFVPLCQPWQDKVCEHSALDGQPGRDREKVEAGPPPPLALVADGCVRDPRCPKNISSQFLSSDSHTAGVTAGCLIQR